MAFEHAVLVDVPTYTHWVLAATSPTGTSGWCGIHGGPLVTLSVLRVSV